MREEGSRLPVGEVERHDGPGGEHVAEGETCKELESRREAGHDAVDDDEREAVDDQGGRRQTAVDHAQGQPRRVVHAVTT